MDPKIIEVLQFLQNGFVRDKFIDHSTANIHQRFAGGKIAMIMERKMVSPRVVADMRDEWDFAPFPKGPSAKQQMNPTGSGSWAIPAGAKNPQGGVAWIYLYQKISKEQQEETYSKTYTKEQFERIKKAEENIALFSHDGLGFRTLLIRNVFNPLKSGMPISTTIEQAVPLFEEAIKSLLSGN